MSVPYLMFFSGVGNNERKENVRNIIKALEEQNIRHLFDIIICCYEDETLFEEKEFENCEIYFETGVMFYFMYKYLTPNIAYKYEKIIISFDDIVLTKLNFQEMFDIMDKNKLDVASPALTNDSLYFHQYMVNKPSYEVGRLSEFAEFFLICFNSKTYCDFHQILEPSQTNWGWGYDMLIYPLFKSRIGILDCQLIKHTHLSTDKNHEERLTDKRRVLDRYSNYGMARKLTIASLR